MNERNMKDSKNTQKYEKFQLSRKDIMVNNFLGGIAWGVGTSIGLTVVVALISLILRQIEVVPIFGSFVLSITEFVKQNGR